MVGFAAAYAVDAIGRRLEGLVLDSVSRKVTQLVARTRVRGNTPHTPLVSRALVSRAARPIF